MRSASPPCVVLERESEMAARNPGAKKLGNKRERKALNAVGYQTTGPKGKPKVTGYKSKAGAQRAAAPRPYSVRRLPTSVIDAIGLGSLPPKKKVGTVKKRGMG